MLDLAGSVPRFDAVAAWPDGGRRRWVEEPRKHAPGLDSLLSWAFEAGASRIGLQPGHPVWVSIHGRNRRVTEQTLDEAEFASIVNHLYGADGMARLQGGNDIDTAYSIHVHRSRRLRFRLNATPTRTARRDGGNVVLRPIPDFPPNLDEHGVEAGILDAYRPRNGMVIVSGSTGSGKSTLIAGMTLAKLLDPDAHCNILEGAAPVEFLLERVRGPNSTINQTEIPRDLPSFVAFIRGCMGRERTDIIVGECRDPETMGAAIQAAISGHALTTVPLAPARRPVSPGTRSPVAPPPPHSRRCPPLFRRGCVCRPRSCPLRARPSRARHRAPTRSLSHPPGRAR